MRVAKPTSGRNALLLLALGFLALLGTSVLSLRAVKQTQSIAASVNDNSQLRRAAWNLRTLLQDAETGQRGFLLSQDEAYLRPYTAAIDALPEAFPHMRALAAGDPYLEGRVESLSLLSSQKLGELAKTIALQRAGRRAAALALVRTGKGRTIMDDARTTLAEMIGHLDARQGRAVQLALHTSEKLLNLTILGEALIIIFAAGAIWIVVGYTQDLRRAEKQLRAAHAELEQRVTQRTEQLAMANVQLERANEEVQRFAYIVSHDLRAPLVNIMGFTSELELSLKALQGLVDTVGEQSPELLQPDARDAAREDLPEAIAFIRSSTVRMDRLINAILRLSREGRRPLNPEPIAMTELIESIAASLQHQFDAAGARLTIEGRLPDLISDRLGLEQIFGNLLDNAIKYLHPTRPGEITVRGRVQGANIAYEVADNGRGIAEADRGRIFELFRRAGSQDQPGEGIGLAHVRAMVRRLGGSIECASQHGQGSAFHVTLPKILSGTGKEQAA